MPSLHGGSIEITRTVNNKVTVKNSGMSNIHRYPLQLCLIIDQECKRKSKMSSIQNWYFYCNSYFDFCLCTFLLRKQRDEIVKIYEFSTYKNDNICQIIDLKKNVKGTVGSMLFIVSVLKT